MTLISSLFEQTTSKDYSYIGPLVLAALIIYLCLQYFQGGLNKFPGPFLANFTDLWRFFDVWGRRPDVTHIRLHRKYGDVVRLGPRALSFADPNAIKVIYGLNKGFTKVWGISWHDLVFL
jgi:hypothetical protein